MQASIPLLFGQAMHFSLICFLVIFTFSVIFPGTGGEYLLLDDDDYFTANPFVKGGLTWDGIRWAFTATHSGHWHPLTWISLMIDAELFGESSDASRLVNIVIHSAAVGILFTPVRHLVRSTAVAVTACAIFAVHPLRLESVLWVSERKDVLSFFFFAMVLAFYERGVRVNSSVSRSLAWMAAFLGLLTKPTLVTLPLLLIAIDYLHSTGTVTVSRAFGWIIGKWAYWIIAMAAAVAAVIGQTAAGGLKSSQALSVGERLSNVGIGYCAYLGRLFWPFDLSVFYPLQSIPSAIGIGCNLLLFGCSILMASWICQTRERERQLLAVSWFWFLIALLPVIGVVQVGWQQFADRWSYIPHLLPIVAISQFVKTRLIAFRWSAVCIATAIVGLLAVETNRQAPLWLNSIALFNQSLKVTQQNFFVMTNLGVGYERIGDSGKAMELYREALRFNPVYPVALNNIGALLAKEGRYADSLVYFHKALLSFPNYVPAQYHLALALLRLQEASPSIYEWIALLQINPEHGEARAMLKAAVDLLLARGCPAQSALSRSHPRFPALLHETSPTDLALLESSGCIIQ